MLSIVRLDHWEAIFDFIFHITLKGMLTAVKAGEIIYHLVIHICIYISPCDEIYIYILYIYISVYAIWPPERAT